MQYENNEKNYDFLIMSNYSIVFVKKFQYIVKIVQNKIF